MPKITALADLADLTPGAVFVAANARIHLGYEEIEGEIVIAEDGKRTVAAVSINDSSLIDAVRRGELSAKCDVRMRGGVGTVTDIWLIRGDGNAAWFHGQHREELSAECRYWKPRIALASMTGQPALAMPVGSRPPGEQVCRLELRGDITYDTAEEFEEKIEAAAGRTIDLQIRQRRLAHLERPFIP